MLLGPRQQALVDALRSGKFQQGTERLRGAYPAPNYCCLGVACELSGLGKWEPHPYQPIYYYETPDGDSSDASLPRPVMNYYGFNDTYGKYKPIVTGDLTYDNDHGMTFDQIADLIEANAEAMFKEPL